MKPETSKLPEKRSTMTDGEYFRWLKSNGYGGLLAVCMMLRSQKRRAKARAPLARLAREGV